MDDLLVWGGHHALSINLNDPMSHADAAPLSDSPSHQAADLSVKGQVTVLGKELSGVRRLSFLEPSAPCILLSEKLPQLGFGHLNLFVSLHKK